MKVLHVIPSVSPAHGGPSFGIRVMAEGLAGLGVHVDVVTTTADRNSELAVPTGAFREQGGWRCLFFPRQAPRSWTFSWPLTRWLFSRVADYDLLHVHAVFSYPTIPACAAARQRGLPYVVRPAGMLDPWSLAYRGWKKRPYYAVVERRNLKGAAAVHATSAWEAENLARLGLGNIHVIPLAVGLPAAADSAQRPQPTDALRLLFLGRLHPKKGLPVLLSAVDKLRGQAVPVHLTIAGAGDARYRGELESRVDGVGLTPHVEFTGFVEGERKAELFRRSHVFVLPSYQENFGIAVAEALAYGLPVVISDQVALAQEVREAGAGRVVPVDNATSLAEALRGYADPEARQCAARNARSLAAQRFDHDALAAALFRLYAGVLNPSGA
jgi:glycosyltransferase involved in cell wall biosynthesis